MPTIPLSPGETFVLSKKNGDAYIKSSTDSVEQSLFIRNDIYVTGSAAGEGTTIFNTGYIELTNTNTDPYIVFKPSTVTLQNFVLGYDDSQNQFALGTGNALSPGATRTVFHVPSGSRTLHVDEGLTVTGSVSVIEPTVTQNYTYTISHRATASAQTAYWNVPSTSYDRLFYISQEYPTDVGSWSFGVFVTTTKAPLFTYIKVHDKEIGFIRTVSDRSGNGSTTIETTFPIPAYQTASITWVKGDMVYAGGGSGLNDVSPGKVIYIGTEIKLGHTI